MDMRHFAGLLPGPQTQQEPGELGEAGTGLHMGGLCSPGASGNVGTAGAPSISGKGTGM